MAAPRGKSSQGITNYKLAVAELVKEMQQMMESGKSLQEIYGKLGGRIEDLRQKSTTLSNAMKGGAARAREAAKSQKELDQANANLNLRLRAIAATYKELESIENKALSTTRKSIQSNAELAKSINKNAQSSKKVVTEEEKLRKQSQERLKQILKKNQALRKQGKENERLKKTIENLKNASKKLGTQVKETSTRFTRFGTGVANALKTLSRFAAAGALTAGALKVVKFFTVDAAKAAINFQKSLFNLAAVAGKSKEEAKALGEAALDVAGKTSFTATQVLGLQTELAKLGFTSSEIVSATEGIAFAAQALGVNLESMAESVGKVINQFGLLKSEADLVGDILVTTINNSALTFDTFGTAIQYVGPIARNLNLDLQQTAGAMAVLADNGFTASRIGTGLRGILTEISSTSYDASKALKQLAEDNISISEAIDLVGKRNAAQLITLIKNIEVIEEGNEKYYEQGRAMKASAIQASSFSGQMDIMNSALERFLVDVGSFVANSNIITAVLGQFSQEAAGAIRAFQFLGDVDYDRYMESVNRAAKETSPLIEAIELLAETDEEVAAKKDYLLFQVEKFGKVFPNAGNVTNELAQKVNGLNSFLETAAEKVIRTDLATQGATRAQQAWGDAVDRIGQRYEKNNLSLEDAEALYTKVSESSDALGRTEKALNDELQNSINLTEERKQELERALVGVQKEKAATDQYGDTLINIIGLEKKRREEAQKGIKVKKREAETFKELVAEAEARKDALIKQAEIDKATNEANKEFQANSARQVYLNRELTDANNDLITTLQEKKAALEAELATKDANTKQGEYDIRIMNREIGTLEKLIEKYKEKNQELEISADSVKMVADNAKLQIEALRKEYEDGDITGVAFQRGERAIVEAMKSDLEALAAAAPELEKLVNAIINNFELQGEVDWNEILYKGIDEAISTTIGALEGFNDTAFENTKARLDAEKEAIKARYETEDYLAKQQFENGLINEAQYRRRQQELRKKQVAEENALEKKLFEANQKKDRNDAKVEFLEAVASIIPTLIKEGIAEPTTLNIMAAITAASAAASYAAEVSAINQRKFYPKKFAQGGMVYGPSHQEGGVPFSVQGQGGYEMEGGEFIINKRAASLHRDLLEKINGSVKPNTTPSPTKFATGGVVTNSVTNIGQQSQESVNYLKTIAEATMTNAINSSKPVRAFVTSTDLRKDETARRIKDNNTTI